MFQKTIYSSGFSDKQECATPAVVIAYIQAYDERVAAEVKKHKEEIAYENEARKPGRNFM